jgi:hypothetical protein
LYAIAPAAAPSRPIWCEDGRVGTPLPTRGADRERLVALLIARARVGLGAGLLVAAGPSARVALGGRTREARAALRLVGGRDLALGLGALTCVHERTLDAEWVSMGALVDGLDALVLLGTPRLPARSRLVGLVAAAAGLVGWLAAQRLADDREAVLPDGS